jgi:hypothetical protein
MMMQVDALKGLRKHQAYFDNVIRLSRGVVPAMAANIEKVEVDCQRLLNWQSGTNQVAELPGYFFPQYR